MNHLPTEGNEPCSTARGQKKIQLKGGSKKKFLIKQDHLSVLLQKALEKKLSQKNLMLAAKTGDGLAIKNAICEA